MSGMSGALPLSTRVPQGLADSPREESHVCGTPQCAEKATNRCWTKSRKKHQQNSLFCFQPLGYSPVPCEASICSVKTNAGVLVVTGMTLTAQESQDSFRKHLVSSCLSGVVSFLLV